MEKEVDGEEMVEVSDTIQNVITALNAELKKGKKADLEKLRQMLPDFMLAWREEQKNMAALLNTVKVLPGNVKDLDKKVRRARKVPKQN